MCCWARRKSTSWRAHRTMALSPSVTDSVCNTSRITSLCCVWYMSRLLTYLHQFYHVGMRLICISDTCMNIFYHSMIQQFDNLVIR
jgi:hypothetical protein